MDQSRRTFLKNTGKAGAAIAGIALGLSTVSEPAQASTSIHDNCRVTGGAFTGYYRALCPCGWRGNKFTWRKSGAKAGATGEKKWHQNNFGG